MIGRLQPNSQRTLDTVSKYFKFRLVHKALAEHQVLLAKITLHIICPLRFILPRVPIQLACRNASLASQHLKTITMNLWDDIYMFTLSRTAMAASFSGIAARIRISRSSEQQRPTSCLIHDRQHRPHDEENYPLEHHHTLKYFASRQPIPRG